jgi:subtilisin family serine protease
MHRNSLALLSLAAALAVLTIVAAAQAAPNDPLYGPRQWGPKQIKAEQAWTTSTGAGQIIAVVDSGIDLSHPDLAGKIVGGATFTGCANNGPCGNGDWLSGGQRGQPPSPHGTHVAGIAAATTGNGVGVAGVAPDARLLAVKVLTDEGGSFEEIAAGIRWSVDNGTDVINMSLGAIPGAQALPITGLETSVRDAVDYAQSQGVVVVAAAGNDAVSVCGEPSFDPDVLCVVSTDRNEARAWYSNFGASEAPLNAVAAPGGQGLVSCGEDVVSTVPSSAGGTCTGIMGTPGYDFYAGTSMATPHVAGVAALLKAQGRSAAQVVSVLKSTARKPGTTTRGVYDPVYGYGIVDAAAAVAAP